MSGYRFVSWICKQDVEPVIKGYFLELSKNHPLAFLKCLLKFYKELNDFNEAEIIAREKYFKKTKISK